MMLGRRSALAAVTVAVLTLLCMTTIATAVTAPTVTSCKNDYANDLLVAFNQSQKCDALEQLNACFLSIDMISDLDRYSAQGFLDAAVFAQYCPGFVVVPIPSSNPLNTDLTYLNTGVSRDNDVKFFRQMSSEIDSFWNINDQLQTFQTQLDSFLKQEDVVSSISSAEGYLGNLDARTSRGIISQEENLRKYTDQAVTTLIATFKTLVNNVNKESTSRLDVIEGDVIATKRFISNCASMQASVSSAIASSATSTLNIAPVILPQWSAINSVATAVSSAATPLTTSVSTSLSSLRTSITSSVSSAMSTIISINSSITNIPQVVTNNPVYRWAVWSTYSQNYGQWYANNWPNMFGGQYASYWGDNSAYASSISANKDQQRTLFNKRGFGGWSTTVWAEEWYYYSSTNSRHAGVHFRIKNSTPNAIPWGVYWMFSLYGGWSETASVAINGADVYTTTTSCGYCQQYISIFVPANRVSTVIFISSSSAPSTTRTLYSGFYNDCLKLPTGLQYVDDLDYASGGWEA